MAQQTAIEWLVEQLQAPCRGIPSHIIEQAKAMEREQQHEEWKRGFIEAKDLALEQMGRLLKKDE